MSELLTASAETPDVAQVPEHAIEAVGQAPILITEREVAFSTAAAVPLPRTKPNHRVIAALRAMFRSSAADTSTAPRHYPPRRDEFLEQASMAREMYRL